MREAYGIIAYRAGDFRTASRELRTALRITGRTDLLPMIADCERGLGRPERALDIAASDDASKLGVVAAIELMIVVAGAYADTGDIQTALRTLEIPALRHKVDGRWQVRLWVAYADLLARAERPEEAKRWLTLAADADTEGLTDAAERLGRPVPVTDEEPTWEDDEQIAVLDAYDPEAEEPAADEVESEDGESDLDDADPDAAKVEQDASEQVEAEHLEQAEAEYADQADPEAPDSAEQVSEDRVPAAQGVQDVEDAVEDATGDEAAPAAEPEGEDDPVGAAPEAASDPVSEPAPTTQPEERA
ncbi:hypothetical protein [Brachybacterium sp. UNK5269]|uniref:hypothetical protein n=1 Tax=Brachybacterium sp. UNK5269 TaxID=3408576 RepID=UPI003BB15529